MKKSYPLYILIFLFLIPTIISVQACTFIVDDPYASSKLTFINSNQGYFKLQLTSAADNSTEQIDDPIYLDFINNSASLEQFPLINETRWSNDVELSYDWYLQTDGISLEEHITSNKSWVEIFNGTVSIYNLTIPEYFADFFFISFYYPLDQNVYVISEAGQVVVFDIDLLQINAYNETKYLLPISTSSIPSKNYGMLFVYSGGGSCEYGRYYLPTSTELKYIVTDSYFNTVSIDPDSHSIYTMTHYISDAITIEEINFITFETDSWSFSVKDLMPSESPIKSTITTSSTSPLEKISETISETISQKTAGLLISTTFITLAVIILKKRK